MRHAMTARKLFARALCCVAFGLLVGPGVAGAAGDERLIVGFETKELASRQIAGWCELKRLDDGCDFWANFEAGLGNRAWTWHCRQGDATEGEQALVRVIGRGRRLISFRETPFQERHYPVLRSRSDASVLLNVFQWLPHVKGNLGDWRGYDRLWIDLKTDHVLERVWLCVEDETIEPPVVRLFEDVGGEAWVTLEVDLREAERRRGLDLEHVVNFYVLGRAAERATVRVDNVRLVRGRPAGRFKVLRDDSPMTGVTPELPAMPVVPILDEAFTPDRSPVTLEPPRVVGEGSLVPVGWIAAADNRHLLLAGTRRSRRRRQSVVVMQSNDGGTTWEGLAGPKVINLDHGTTRGCVVDARGDSVVVSGGPGCAGIGVPSPRQHLTKYTFTGLDWEHRPWAAILDYDIRHCGTTASVVRLPRGAKEGRLWAAWGSLDRTRRLVVHAKFSDDDGETWWHVGRSAMIPDSAESAFSVNSYGYQQPRVTYFRGHSAVFWQDARGLRWSRFDGERWLRPEVIDLEAKAKLAVSENESFRVPGSVVTVGEDEVLLTAWNRRGVFHYDGEKWRRELLDADDAGTLTVCGDGDVMLITAGHTEEPPATKRIQITRQAKVLAWRRRRDGTWAPPLDLADGTVTLHEYRQMTAVVVPPRSPANFAPVAFSDGEHVRMVKVPVLGE